MIRIGEFTLHVANGFLWIRRKSGEAMALNALSVEELEKLIADFWKRHF